MGRFLQPNPDAGDPNTIGGYRAVHERPAAFEGKDGAAYSVELVVDEVRDPRGRYGAYMLFVRWGRGDTITAGHLETPYTAFADTESEARAAIGAMSLSDARRALDALIDSSQEPSRPWYESMRDA